MYVIVKKFRLIEKQKLMRRNFDKIKHEVISGSLTNYHFDFIPDPLHVHKRP